MVIPFPNLVELLNSPPCCNWKRNAGKLPAAALKKGQKSALPRRITFSNPSASLDRRRRMPGKRVCLFHNGRAPGRRVLRLYRPAASKNLHRSTLARSSRREERSRPVREQPEGPACQLRDAGCGEDLRPASVSVATCPLPGLSAVQ